MELDSLFEREKDLSAHVKDVGVTLLDISDSVKDKLSQQDQNDVKDALITLRMNCDAMREDIGNAEGMLKKIKTTMVEVRGVNIDVKETRKQLADVKVALERLRKNAEEFLSARDRALVFKEMNNEYGTVLSGITELIAV
ncbi:hypothetical protein HY492_01950 [Candidatus Woesearchaeota archaeon]|nr:hypothetical protein [Candidatus Woesearchaeota archaeon]